jgi:hypothetical protein
MDSFDEANVGLAGAGLLVAATLAVALMAEFTTLKPPFIWMIACCLSVGVWRLLVTVIGCKSRERRGR